MNYVLCIREGKFGIAMLLLPRQKMLITICQILDLIIGLLKKEMIIGRDIIRGRMEMKQLLDGILLI